VKVASLVPAATDLIVAMGAADHLVAVSNWDSDRPEIKQLPRVGDYQTTDWERLAELRPDVMLVFMSIDRMPPGMKERADHLGIRLVNVQTETIADVFNAIDRLGQIMQEPDRASDLAKKIHGQLDAVKQRVAGKEPVPTMLARDEQGYALIAGNTFADELLTIAGGRNVVGDSERRYPNVDRERVIELAPQAIIQLMPGATPQVIDQARASWAKLPNLPAVKNDRVYILSDWYVLQPGSHIGDIAEQMAKVLHP
jgi:iron complex transport system substrate-binding protein